MKADADYDRATVAVRGADPPGRDRQPLTKTRRPGRSRKSGHLLTLHPGPQGPQLEGDTMLTIKIADVGTQSEYTLDGAAVTMTTSGGCADVLVRDAVPLDESMADDQIQEIVWEAWARDYVGDPESSGLRVIVCR